MNEHDFIEVMLYDNMTTEKNSHQPVVINALLKKDTIEAFFPMYDKRIIVFNSKKASVFSPDSADKIANALQDSDTAYRKYYFPSYAECKRTDKHEEYRNSLFIKIKRIDISDGHTPEEYANAYVRYRSIQAIQQDVDDKLKTIVKLRIPESGSGNEFNFELHVKEPFDNVKKEIQMQIALNEFN